MKKMILLAVAAAGIFTLAASAQAGEPLYSPKAKALADSLKKVPAVTSDVNLALDRPAGNAKAWELARSFRSVPSTGPKTRAMKLRSAKTRPASSKCRSRR